MKFIERRRQQFLGEVRYEYVVSSYERVVNGPDGLLSNLALPESEPGWHMDLRRGLAQEGWQLLLARYTAGEPIESLRQYLDSVVSAYEAYAPLLRSYVEDISEPVFKFFNIDEYCQLMQMVGLCFLLHRRDLLARVASLQDGEDGQNGGADNLFEEFMSHGLGAETRYESDWISAEQPYKSLSNALFSESNDEALVQLDHFLKNWYKDLSGCGWHGTHSSELQGGYHGYWSFEAGAAVILLGIEDDSSLHKYLYYPRELVEWCRANYVLAGGGGQDSLHLRCAAGQPCPKDGTWFTPARLDSRRHFALGEMMPEVGGPFGATIWQWVEGQ